MHSYEVEGRGKVVIALAGLGMVPVWLLNVGLEAVDFEPQWWVSVPSFAGFYSGLYWVFDHYLWRLEALKKLRIVRAPNLNGKWEGTVKSSYNQYACGFPVTVAILQRWSKISISLETNLSRSRSITASLRTVDVKAVELTYQYLNEPKPHAPASMEIHRGTAFLQTTDFGLEGTYYSGRGRREIGSIELRRV